MSGDTPISISGNERSAYVSRPLEASYPLVFLDAIRVKIRDEGLARNKAPALRTRLRPCKQCESEPVGEVARVGGRELGVGVGHAPR